MAGSFTGISDHCGWVVCSGDTCIWLSFVIARLPPAAAHVVAVDDGQGLGPNESGSRGSRAAPPATAGPLGPGASGSNRASSPLTCWCLGGPDRPHPDRKSTRLNSSHVEISYAVVCLKKKKEQG